MSRAFEDEAALSTRGQWLPQLIQNRSSSSLYSDGLNASTPRKRQQSRQGLADASDEDPELGLGRRTSRTPRQIKYYGASSSVSGDGRGIDMDGPAWDFVDHPPTPPSNFPLTKGQLDAQNGLEKAERRASLVASVLLTPQMRSQRLIGNSNPRYRWEKYYQSEQALKNMKKPL